MPHDPRAVERLACIAGHRTHQVGPARSRFDAPAEPPSNVYEVAQRRRAREETNRSPRSPKGRTRLQFTARPNRIRALCFGYFHLGPQMKVTRPRGGTPRVAASDKPINGKRTEQAPPLRAP